MIKNKKPLPETHPHLLEEWDFDKNEIRPEEITPGSGKKVWWKCKKEDCGYEWKAFIFNRTRKIKPKGCPACVGQVVTDKNRFSLLHPGLAKEWDYTKNGNLCPEDVTYGSKKKVWWVCKKCGYSWKAFIFNRTRKVKPRGCPACVNQVVTEKNNLAVAHPHLLEEWDYEKNEVRPEEVNSGTGKKVWWKCSNKKCGYGWAAKVCNRTTKGLETGCPACAGKAVTSKNSLGVLYPKVSQDWDYIKNKDICPDKIVSGSHMKVWWLCSVCGYSWKALVEARTRKKPTGCPQCSKSPVSKSSQKWLDFLGIKDREHYFKGLGFRVDGFDPKTNTIYEFLGDYWHGNPERFDLNKINKHVKKTFGQLHQETMERIETLKENGYKVVYIWEKDFKQKQEKV